MTLAKLAETKKSLIFRIQNPDGSFAILKKLKSEFINPDGIKKLQHEFEVLHKLENFSSHVIKPLKLNEDGIVFEDFDGSPLAVLVQQEFPLRALLTIAIELAQGLGEIHHQNIIHKDIKPQNILINPKTSQIKYIDFGICSPLAREIQQHLNPTSIEGTLSYISPEQTGRMNRLLDYRTDIYSLGITFYELFTHQLPFDAKTPMEMIHMHIAKHPRAPSQINPDIPQALSDIILKCLKKVSEDRYRSAFGLKNDLMRCLDQLDSQGVIEPFILGEQDVFDHFHIPTKLYGREEEMRVLLSCFRKVVKGQVRVILLKGYAGTGKSRLINELQRPILSENGIFIKGKFDPYKKHQPYHGLIMALQQLIERLLAEPEDQLVAWREKILKAIGTIGQVLIDIVPTLKNIIGEQPPVPNLEPQETENRLFYILTKFLEVFLDSTHPLVIFLDDLQWTDEYSIKFLENFLSDFKHNYFLFIGSLRDNEVVSSHPINWMCDALKKAAVPIEEMQIQPLSLKALQEMLQDSFQTPESETFALAQKVNQKTLGNPFFVGQFLRLLYHQGLIEFDLKNRCWKANLLKIDQLQVTDNVAELMTKKIKSFPTETQSLLKIGACMGNPFDLKIVSKLEGISLENALHSLNPSIEEELIFHEKEHFFVFQHDRIQQACYQLSSEEERSRLHYQIGITLLQQIPHDEQFDSIFEIVNHLNEGLSFIEENKKHQFAQLNWLAAQKAKMGAAFDLALVYLRAALSLLGKNAWEQDPSLSFQLYSNLALCEQVQGNSEEAERLFDLCLAKTEKKIDKATIYSEKMILYEKAANYQKSIETGLEALKLFHVKVPIHPSTLRLFYEFIKVKSLLLFIDIKKLPKLEDPEISAILSLFGSLNVSFYLSGDKNTLGFSTLKVFQKTLLHGMSHASLGSMVALAMILGWLPWNQYEKSYQFGRTILDICHLFPKTFYNYDAQFVFYLFLGRWGMTYRECSQALKELANHLYEVGHLPNVVSCYTMSLLLAILSGQSLDELKKQGEADFNSIKKHNIMEYNVFLLVCWTF